MKPLMCSLMPQIKQVTLHKRSGQVKDHSKVKWLDFFAMCAICTSILSVRACVMHGLVHVLFRLLLNSVAALLQGFQPFIAITCPPHYSNKCLCLQKVGVLTAEVVSSCVSNLGRFGSGLHHLYHHLSLPVSVSQRNSQAFMYVDCLNYQDICDKSVCIHIMSCYSYVNRYPCSLY